MVRKVGRKKKTVPDRGGKLKIPVPFEELVKDLLATKPPKEKAEKRKRK